jgi:hypothetical protein
VTVCIPDNVVQESCVGFRLICWSSIDSDIRSAFNCAIHFSRVDSGITYLSDLKASIPIAEYFKEQSLASFTSSSATWSSVRISWGEVMLKATASYADRDELRGYRGVLRGGILPHA